MKILYDHQIFSSQVYGGVSRYFCELFQEFNLRSKIEWYVSIHFSNNAYFRRLYSIRQFFPHYHFRGRDRILEKINRTATLQALGKNNFDLFHSTHSKPYWSCKISQKPCVITVHDMNHEFYPEIPGAKREILDEKLSIEYASGIIVPTVATRQNIINIYPDAKKKIRVIHHGVSPITYFAQVNNLPKHYFLYVGTRDFFKNFPLALKGFAQTAIKNRSLKLLCVGGKALSVEEEKLIKKLDIVNQVIQISLSDAELATAYRNAIALLFPSKSEGFGLPVIEAFNADCPVLLSDIPCFREVAADAAEFFSIDTSSDCAALIAELIKSSHLRDDLKRRGKRRLKAFSRQSFAEKTLNFYKKLL